MDKQNNEILVHLLEKVDKIHEDVVAVRVDQAEIKVDLRYHIKRTDLLETLVKELQKAVNILLIPATIIKAVLRWFRIIK